MKNSNIPHEQLFDKRKIISTCLFAIIALFSIAITVQKGFKTRRLISNEKMSSYLFSDHNAFKSPNLGKNIPTRQEISNVKQNEIKFTPVSCQKFKFLVKKKQFNAYPENYQSHKPNLHTSSYLSIADFGYTNYKYSSIEKSSHRKLKDTANLGFIPGLALYKVTVTIRQTKYSTVLGFIFDTGPIMNLNRVGFNFKARSYSTFPKEYISFTETELLYLSIANRKEVLIYWPKNTVHLPLQTTLFNEVGTLQTVKRTIDFSNFKYLLPLLNPFTWELSVELWGYHSSNMKSYLNNLKKHGCSGGNFGTKYTNNHIKLNDKNINSFTLGPNINLGVSNSLFCTPFYNTIQIKILKRESMFHWHSNSVQDQYCDTK